jgi:hypothetical protein
MRDTQVLIRGFQSKVGAQIARTICVSSYVSADNSQAFAALAIPSAREIG